MLQSKTSTYPTRTRRSATTRDLACPCLLLTWFPEYPHAPYSPPCIPSLASSANHRSSASACRQHSGFANKSTAHSRTHKVAVLNVVDPWLPDLARQLAASIQHLWHPCANILYVAALNISIHGGLRIAVVIVIWEVRGDLFWPQCTEFLSRVTGLLELHLPEGNLPIRRSTIQIVAQIELGPRSL
jgi:hypothetical protein